MPTMFHSLEEVVDPTPWLDRPGRASRVLAVAGALGGGCLAWPVAEASGWWPLVVLVFPGALLYLGYAWAGWVRPERPHALAATSLVFHFLVLGLALLWCGLSPAGTQAKLPALALGVWGLTAIQLTHRAWLADGFRTHRPPTGRG